jgi:hypothetical protein
MAGLGGLLLGVVQLLIAVFVDLSWIIRALIAATGVCSIGIGASLIQAELRKDKTG